MKHVLVILKRTLQLSCLSILARLKERFYEDIRIIDRIEVSRKLRCEHVSRLSIAGVYFNFIQNEHL